MKAFILLIFLTVLGTVSYSQNAVYYHAVSDTLVIDTTNHQQMLLGYTDMKAFQKDTSFSWWFNSLYDMYDIDSVTAGEFKDKLDSADVTIVMGTWCSDSRRLVPKLLRILDYLNFPKTRITIIAVDHKLKGRENETEGLDIKSVPTVIFSKDNKEIGRIIEFPKESYEKDIAKLLNG